MVAVFERASRIALVASIAAITLFQLAFHPDSTPALQWAGLGALLLGALVGPLASGLGVAAWIAVAPLAPALLRLATGREGPVLDTVWMAGLAGALLRAGVGAGWSLPPLWRLLLGGWALILTLAWPIVVARELGFEWHTLRDDAAVNSWAMLTAARVVAWTLYVVQTQLLGLLWFDWLWGRFARETPALPRAFHALWIGVTLASAVAVYQGAIDLTFLSTAFWAGEKRAAGTLLDANGYGMLAALAAPVAAWLLRSRLPALLAVCGVNGIGLWMSGSRTALIGAVAGAIGLAAGTIFERRGRSSAFAEATADKSEHPDQRKAPRIAIALVALVVVVGALFAAGGTVGPLRRIAEVPLSRAGLAALWSRGGYGTIAVQMLRETPWTGVGPGMYHVIAPDYQRVSNQMRLAFDNAQNWWRHQASELGALGALPVLAWSALLAAGVLVAVPREGRRDAWLPRALLAGIGVASLVGMPTQNPIVLLWFFALVAWWSTASTGSLAEGRIGSAAARTLAVALLALALLHAGGTALLARGWLSVPERARRAHRDYVVGAYDLELLAGATPFRWTNGDARFLWAAPTRWLLLRLWVQHPDVASSPVRVTVATPCGGVVVDEPLESSDPLRVGIELPDGADIFEATIRTSRTWQPAARPPGDTRQLGVAVVSDWLKSSKEAHEQTRFVAPKSCDS